MKDGIKKIVSISLIMCLCLCFVGCNETQKAQNVVNELFRSIKNNDFQTAYQYMDVFNLQLEEDDFQFENIISYIFNKAQYKIISSTKVDNDNVVVRVELTSADMRLIAEEFIKKIMDVTLSNALNLSKDGLSKEEANQKFQEIFKECLDNFNGDTVKREVDIKVSKIENKWKVVVDEALFNALLIDLPNILKEFKQSFSNIS